MWQGFRTFLLELRRDERGGATIEYALVASLVIIGTLAAIGAIGVRLLARWKTVDAAGI